MHQQQQPHFGVFVTCRFFVVALFLLNILWLLFRPFFFYFSLPAWSAFWALSFSPLASFHSEFDCDCTYLSSRGLGGCLRPTASQVKSKKSLLECRPLLVGCLQRTQQSK
jgi:hypothetical protein